MLEQFPSFQLGKYGWLLLGFCLVFGVLPLAPDRPLMVNLVLSLLLLAATSAISKHRGVLLLALLLLVPSLAGKWAEHFLGPPVWVRAGSVATQGLFLWVITICIYKDVFHNKVVTKDRLMGAVCIYLLLGMLFASGYQFLESLNPGSFSDAAGAMGPLQEASRLIYFSYVTLTTLGYGDIAPRLASARFLAVLEAITGQLYLAIMVARLLGLHLASSINQSALPEPEQAPQRPSESES